MRKSQKDSKSIPKRLQKKQSARAVIFTLLFSFFLAFCTSKYLFSSHSLVTKTMDSSRPNVAALAKRFEQRAPPVKPVKPAHLKTTSRNTPPKNPFEDALPPSITVPATQLPLTPAPTLTPELTPAPTLAPPHQLVRKKSEEEIQRGHILKELVDSEKTFLADMELLQHVCDHLVHVFADLRATSTNPFYFIHLRHQGSLWKSRVHHSSFLPLFARTHSR